MTIQFIPFCFFFHYIYNEFYIFFALMILNSPMSVFYTSEVIFLDQNHCTEGKLILTCFTGFIIVPSYYKDIFICDTIMSESVHV